MNDKEMLVWGGGFLGSPVVKIPRFQCGGAGSVLVQGTETLHAVW